MNLNEQVERIKSLIYELSPQSEGVIELIKIVEEFPELLEHLQFTNIKELKNYITDAGYEDFQELKNEIEYFFNRRKRYFQDEMNELERAVQDLTRDENLDISIDDVLTAFIRAKEQPLTNDVWKQLENTESNTFTKGDMKKVIAMAKKYGKQDPNELKRALKSGQYRRPLILKFGDRYHLVAGNTRLSTAAALGITPQVIIANYNID